MIDIHVVDGIDPAEKQGNQTKQGVDPQQDAQGLHEPGGCFLPLSGLQVNIEEPANDQSRPIR